MQEVIMESGGRLGVFEWTSGFKPAPEPDLRELARTRTAETVFNRVNRASALRQQGDTAGAEKLMAEAKKVWAIALEA